MMPARSLRSLLLAGAALTLAVAAQAAEPTTFTVTIKNVSTSETLKLPDGKTTNVPIAPGLYVVGAKPNPLFTVGKPAGEALERAGIRGKDEGSGLSWGSSLLSTVGSATRSAKVHV